MMVFARGALVLALVLALAATCPAAWGQSAPPCPPVAAPMELPVLHAALRRGEPVVIAALGSSSTSGVAASDAAHSYPAVLQAALTRQWVGGHIAVINRGIGGQDAAEALARLGRDAIALRPQLVIWQVGANAAMRNVDPAGFRAIVAAGVTRMREAGADIILMDSQRAQRIMDAPRRGAFEQALREAAQQTGAVLFSRAALMDAWRAGGQDYDQFLAADALHHNDLGYRCLAEALAGAIVSAVRRE